MICVGRDWKLRVGEAVALILEAVVGTQFPPHFGM